MSANIAIIGFPFTGKTTVHSAICGIEREKLPEMPAGSGIHMSTVHYSEDNRLQRIAEIYKSAKITPINIQIYDYPGLDFSSDHSRNYARKLIGQIRQSDLLVIVLRDFEDQIPPYKNRIDPGSELKELLEEFIFADMELLEKRKEKLRESIKKPTPHREEEKKELEFVERLLAALEENKSILQLPLSNNEQKIINTFALLTRLPIIVVINTSEEKLSSASYNTLKEESKQIKDIVVCCARFEAELNQLNEEDRLAFKIDANIKETLKETFIPKVIKALDKAIFYTAGPKEARAWLVDLGTRAQEAAGKVHSDMAKGFIRAEIIAYNDLIECGDEKSAREAGKLRSEGKDYIINDGDVILFRFNV